MAGFYKGVIPIYNPETVKDRDTLFNFRGGHFGYVERDYKLYPESMFDAPSGMKIYEESDWDSLYDEQEAKRTSLEHIFLRRDGQPRFINLDQNGHGYCWAYSTGHSIMIKRLAYNQPKIRLNPHSVAAIIKNGRDEGGWCGLSAQFAREHGYAEEGTGPGQWPLHSRSLQYDTPELRRAMLVNRIVEDYVDLTRQVYDQNLTEKQLASCLFLNNPCPVDFNWWGHSVCAVRWVRIERGNWGLLILNSWKGWGRHGLGVLQGSKRTPNGAVCTRVIAA